jgi:hypothetical protein
LPVIVQRQGVAQEAAEGVGQSGSAPLGGLTQEGAAAGEVAQAGLVDSGNEEVIGVPAEVEVGSAGGSAGSGPRGPESGGSVVHQGLLVRAWAG